MGENTPFRAREGSDGPRRADTPGMVDLSSSAYVGVDIGATALRGVQVARERSSGRFRVVKAASVDLPRGAVRGGRIEDHKAVVAALRRLWRKGRFSTRKVALGISDGGVLTRQVDLPWMAPDDFRAALRYQVADALPVDLATVELDYHPLGEHQRTDDAGQVVDMSRVLVLAASTDGVMAEADAARKARLHPVIADTAAFALIRAACEGRLPDDPTAHAIADIGADQLTVAIHAAGQPRFIRCIANLGGDSATFAVAERLRVSPDDAERIKRECGLNGPAPVVAPIAESSVFAGVVAPGAPPSNPRAAATVEVLSAWATRVVAEVRNSLDYFHASDPEASVASVTVTGRTALLDGLLERLATQLQVPVRVMPPLAGLPARRGAAKKVGDDPGFVVATGLALGA